MAKGEISEWLAGTRDYWAGVQLLKKHSDDRFLVSLLSAREDRYNAEKLSELLVKLAEKEVQKAAILPVDVKSMHEQAALYMDERAGLKATLRVLGDAGKRKIAAFRILEISGHLNELFRSLDFYDRFGHLPIACEIPDDPLDLLKKRANLRTYISKSKKAGNKDRVLLLEKQLKLIDDKLKGHE